MLCTYHDSKINFHYLVLNKLVGTFGVLVLKYHLLNYHQLDILCMLVLFQIKKQDTEKFSLFYYNM